MPFHKQGRDLAVFERAGVKFGVVICSDGGCIEPSRILSLKGARIIFSPHFNNIGKEGLIGHFMRARADHVARAVENGVYFVRGNDVMSARPELRINVYQKCKLARLSFGAGAELPKRYIVA